MSFANDAKLEVLKSELKKDIAKGFALNAKSNLVMAYYRIGLLHKEPK